MHFLEKGPYGRPTLANKLGLSEGRVRVLLNYLKCRGLLTSIRAGHLFTEEGREFWEEVKKKMKILGQVPSPVPEWPFSVAGVFSPSVEISKNGVRERDLAVRYGALGAIVCKVSRGRAKLLGDYDYDLEEIIKTKLPLEGEEGKILMIVGGSSEPAAYVALAKTMIYLAGDPFEFL